MNYVSSMGFKWIKLEMGPRFLGSVFSSRWLNPLVMGSVKRREKIPSYSEKKGENLCFH